VPDSVGQHNHACFKEESGAETASTAEAVGIRFWPLGQVVSREDRGIADRYDVVWCEKRCGGDGGLAGCRRAELVDGLIRHEEDPHLGVLAGGSRHPFRTRATRSCGIKRFSRCLFRKYVIYITSQTRGSEISCRKSRYEFLSFTFSLPPVKSEEVKE